MILLTDKVSRVMDNYIKTIKFHLVNNEALFPSHQKQLIKRKYYSEVNFIDSGISHDITQLPS